MKLRLVACALVVLATAPAAAQTFRSEAGELRVETVARDLANPWGLAFLPDGRMLVTEKSGRMRIVARDGKAVARHRRRAAGVRAQPGRAA